jgi:acetyl esterase/lipase
MTGLLSQARAPVGGSLPRRSLRVRDEGRIHPVLQLLVYPMLDDRTIDAPPTPTPFQMWNPAANRLGWTCYLGTHAGGPGVPDHAAPARRVDLSGLPPAWIGVGTLDLFHDENLTYAQRLQTANVPTTLHIAEGAFHGFDFAAPRAAISLAFRTAQVDALRTAFAGGAVGH